MKFDLGDICLAVLQGYYFHALFVADADLSTLGTLGVGVGIAIVTAMGVAVGKGIMAGLIKAIESREDQKKRDGAQEESRWSTPGPKLPPSA